MLSVTASMSAPSDVLFGFYKFFGLASVLVRIIRRTATYVCTHEERVEQLPIVKPRM